MYQYFLNNNYNLPDKLHLIDISIYSSKTFYPPFDNKTKSDYIQSIFWIKNPNICLPFCGYNPYFCLYTNNNNNNNSQSITNYINSLWPQKYITHTQTHYIDNKITKLKLCNQTQRKQYLILKVPLHTILYMWVGVIRLGK